MKRRIIAIFSLSFSVIVIGAVLSPSAAGSEWWNSGGEADYYEEGAEWKEAEVSLPDVPDESNLLEFQVDNPSSSHQYFLDPNSLSIAEDYVIRYTALIRTRSGATNLFYDGIRCQTREYKNYAFGVNGALIENEGAAWEPVRGYDFFRKALMRGIVCEQNDRPRPVEQVVDRLKYGR